MKIISMVICSIGVSFLTISSETETDIWIVFPRMEPVSIYDFKDVWFRVTGNSNSSTLRIRSTILCSENMLDFVRWNSDFSWSWDSIIEEHSERTIRVCVCPTCNPPFLGIQNTKILHLILRIELLDSNQDTLAVDNSTFSLFEPDPNQSDTSMYITADNLMVNISESIPDTQEIVLAPSENHNIEPISKRHAALASNRTQAMDASEQDNHASPWHGLPSYSLVTKAYIGGWHELIPSLLLSFLVFWPREYGVLVLVLDDEVEDEHIAGGILQLLSPRIEIVFERINFDQTQVFLVNSGEFRLGYDRQRWSRMYSDRQALRIVM